MVNRSARKTKTKGGKLMKAIETLYGELDDFYKVIIPL